MRKVVVIGGGPAGMIAAYSSAMYGNHVILIEKNEKLGKKLYITGKGRCNLTNNVPVSEFFNNVVSNPKFLYGALNNFSSEDTISFFENNGLKLKTERGNRVFPFSSKASDVTKTLERLCVDAGVELMLNSVAKKINVSNGCVVSVEVDGNDLLCDAVIVCTGGISYPLTGSTGDGYGFAKALGHSVVSLRPALVGLELSGSFFKEMQGLSLKNVALCVKDNKNVIFSEQGEMLFTHFGVSGPIVLSCSCLINRLKLENLYAYIDFKPALDIETLNRRLLREFEENKNKSISNVMRSLLPKNVIPEVLKRANIHQEKICCEITVKERQALIENLKQFSLPLKSLRPVDEAIVTSGGVNVKEVNPKTMESKIVKGLFFAGEVLDVDAFTGGFNIQIALSTGYLAGQNA